MTGALVKAYWGLGDLVNSNPALLELAKEHQPLYIPTPYPPLVSNIPGVRCVNPLKFDGLCRGYFNHETKMTAPVYYEHIFDINPKAWRDEEFRADHKDLKVYDCCFSGEAYLPGKNMLNCILVGREMDLQSPRLWLPPSGALADRMADLFLRQHNQEGRHPILFHPTMRQLSQEGVPIRSAPDEVFRQVYDRLRRDFFLFNVERWLSDWWVPYAQHEVPLFHSNTYFGLAVTWALIKRSVAVILQNSCSLMPFSQSLGKPILVGVGGCYVDDRHLLHPGLPPEQRNVTFLEPSNPCRCYKKGCDQTQFKYDLSVVDEFIKKLT